eukprot:UN20717
MQKEQNPGPRAGVPYKRLVKESVATYHEQMQHNARLKAKSDGKQLADNEQKKLWHKASISEQNWNIRVNFDSFKMISAENEIENVKIEKATYGDATLLLKCFDELGWEIPFVLT